MSDQAQSDLERFADAWNTARFFDAHETLEPRWIATRDRGLRGLIQLAAAFHHLSKGNIIGARTTLERAIVRLDDPQNLPCALNQRKLARYASSVLLEIETKAPHDIVSSRPRLQLEKD